MDVKQSLHFSLDCLLVGLHVCLHTLYVCKIKENTKMVWQEIRKKKCGVDCRTAELILILICFFPLQVIWSYGHMYEFPHSIVISTFNLWMAGISSELWVAKEAYDLRKILLQRINQKCAQRNCTQLFISYFLQKKTTISHICNGLSSSLKPKWSMRQ